MWRTREGRSGVGILSVPPVPSWHQTLFRTSDRSQISQMCHKVLTFLLSFSLSWCCLIVMFFSSHVDWLSCSMTAMLIDYCADWLPCWLTTMLIDCHVDWLPCWLTVMLTDYHVDWLSCCLTVILIDCHVMSCWLTVMLNVMLLIYCHVLVPDCCLTVEGAKQVEKHREFYTQVLDYVYCSNTSRKGRASLDQLFNTVEELKEQTKVYTINYLTNMRCMCKFVARVGHWKICSPKSRLRGTNYSMSHKGYKFTTYTECEFYNDFIIL